MPRFGPFRLTDECHAIASRWTFDDLEPAKERSLRVFQSGFVERVLARAHPITPIVWFGPVAVWAFWRALVRDGRGVLATLGLFAAGWLLWTFMEYWLHRALFHFTPKTSEERVKSFMLHGYHHKYPNDRLRLVAPPMMSWPLAIVVSSLSRLALGDVWPVFFAGIAMGYVAYDWIHYYTHHFRPTNPVGRWLRAYHMRHHHEHASSRYGVSSPLWDLVFGTYAPSDRRDSHPLRPAHGPR
jgi:sterol desaturase/sphingolipid hydroxylase (fatty acid hydroxylase superfamily)